MNLTAEKLLEAEFYDIPFEVQKKYKDKSIVELLELLEQNTIRTIAEEDTKYPYVEESFIHRQDGEEILYTILQRLELWKGYHLLQMTRILCNDNEKRIKELEEKFKNHRHKLTEGHYSEKPVW